MDTTLKAFQDRVETWAKSKGWNNPRILDSEAEPTLAEMKLAAIARAHRRLDELAEAVRVDPHTIIGEDVARLLRNVKPQHDCNVHVVLSKLALLHTEITEAVDSVNETGVARWLNVARANEAAPEGKPEGLGSELADAVIRCFQLARDVQIDLVFELERKMDYNDGREHQHGKHA